MHGIDARLHPFGPGTLRVCGPISVHEQQVERALYLLRSSGDLLGTSFIPRYRESLHWTEIDSVPSVDKQVLDRAPQQLVEEPMIGRALREHRQTEPAMSHSGPTVARYRSTSPCVTRCPTSSGSSVC